MGFVHKGQKLEQATQLTKTKRYQKAFTEQWYMFLVFNSKGEMLIQQRQEDKKLWPNLWDVSVGGSVIAGETSSEAASRETMEELGIELDLSEVRPAFTINFHGGFDDCYLVEKDVDN